MPLFSSTKRIRILPENEVDDLFARPDFNNDERLIWFELNQQEQSCLQGKRSFASKIDFMIQLGYFKSKHQFFNFTLNEVKGDVSYIIDRFYKDEKLTDIKVGSIYIKEREVPQEFYEVIA